MSLTDYEAWRCPSRDQYPTGRSVFCPMEGCPLASGCARDRGWLPAGFSGWEGIADDISRVREDLEGERP